MPRGEGKAPRKANGKGSKRSSGTSGSKRGKGSKSTNGTSRSKPGTSLSKRSTSPTSSTSKRTLTKSRKTPLTHATVRASRAPSEPATLAVAAPVIDSGAHVAKLFDALRGPTSDERLTTLLAVIPQHDGRPTLADLRVVQLLVMAIEQALADGASPEIWADFERASALLLRTGSESAKIVEYMAAFERAVRSWHLRPQDRDALIDALTFEISELDPKFTYRDPRLVRRLHEGFTSTLPPDADHHRTRGGHQRSAAGMAAQVAVEWEALGAKGKVNEKAKRAFVERVRRAKRSGG